MEKWESRLTHTFKPTNRGGRTTTGNSKRIQRVLIKKDVHKYSFFHRTAAEWNLLKEKTIMSTSSAVYKQKLQM